MNDTNLAAELARRDRSRKRPAAVRDERRTAKSDSGFALLLAALVGESDAEVPAVASQSERRRVMPVQARRESIPSVAATVAPSDAIELSDHPTGSAPANAAAIAVPPVHTELKSPVAAAPEFANPASAAEGWPKYQDIPPDQEDYGFAEEKSASPRRIASRARREAGSEFDVTNTVQTIDLPSTQVESSPGRHVLRDELLLEVQELLRDETARESEERLRRELAASRARLACFR